MTTQIFHNGHILTERGFETDACVVVEDGHIVAVLHGAPPSTGTHIDLHGGWLAPGFIDVQVNGGGGVLLPFVAIKLIDLALVATVGA